MKRFVYDTIETELEPVDADGRVLDNDESLSFAAQTVVRIADAPWVDAFDTEEFYRLEATVARPIPQEYHISKSQISSVGDSADTESHTDGETITVRKPAEELKAAQWGLDNAPFVLGHPTSGIVTDTQDIHGFWRHPEYVTHDDEPDEQRLSLYVPVTDERAKEWLQDTRGVSVGFFADFDMDVEDPEVDGYQRNLRYDHVAGVTEGRCSVEEGCMIGDSTTESGTPIVHGGCTAGACSCGLHQSSDAAPNETPLGGLHVDEMSTGDWVQWGASGGTAYGKIDEIVREGCTTRGKGDMEVCAEEDDPAVVVEVYDDETGESREEMVRHKMSTLSSWRGPQADSRRVSDVEIEGTSIDLSVPEGAQSAAQAFLNAADDGLVPEDCGTGTGTESARMIADDDVTADRVENDIAPYLHSHEEDVSRDDHPNQWPDEAWGDCGDAQYAAWGWLSLLDWARNTADEIKRARGEDPVYDAARTLTTKSADAEIPTSKTESSLGGISTDAEIPTAKTESSLGGISTDAEIPTAKTESSLGGISTDAEIPTDDEGTPYGVTPSENADDEWKYRLADCNDVKDAYNLRNNGDYDITVETLVSRIKAAAEMHDCAEESRPWMEDADTSDTTDTMTDDDLSDDPDDPTPMLDVADLSVDALAERHEGVAALTDEVADLEATVDEKDEEIETLEATVEELEAVVDEFEQGEREPKAELVDEVLSLTDKWDEAELYETDREVLEDRVDALTDVAASTTTVDTGEDGAITNLADDSGAVDDEDLRLGDGSLDLSHTA